MGFNSAFKGLILVLGIMWQDVSIQRAITGAINFAAISCQNNKKFRLQFVSLQTPEVIQKTQTENIPILLNADVSRHVII